jgi:hypothetical protein
VSCVGMGLSGTRERVGEADEAEQQVDIVLEQYF